MSISPSRLVYVEACPRFKPSPFTNDAADEGTKLHSYMEQLVQEPIDTWQDWIATLHEPESLKALLIAAADKITPYVSMAPQPHTSVTLSRPGEDLLPVEPVIGVFPELKIETSPGRFGFIDLLVNLGDGNYAIIDYKFVRAPSDFELQLAAYACSLSDCLGGRFQSIKSIIVAPYLPEDMTEGLAWEYTPSSISTYKGIIAAINERADDPNLDGHAGTHCEHCKYNGKCRYQAYAVAPQVDTKPLVRVPTFGDLVHPRTLEDRALRRDFIKCAEAMLEAFKDDDKMFFAENPEADLPGYKRIKMPGKATLDVERASEINCEILASHAGALAPSDILDVSIPNMDMLASTISFKTGVSEAEAKQNLKVMLDPYMKHGESYSVFRKVTTKKRIKDTTKP